MAEKSEYVDQVLKWAESNYTLCNNNSSNSSDNVIERKKEVQNQTKEYLTEILDLIAGDIESNVRNISKYLDLQSESLDAITLDIDILFNRLQLKKEKEAKILYEQTMSLDFRYNEERGGVAGGSERAKGGGLEKNDSGDGEDEMDSTIHGLLLKSKNLVRIDDDTNLRYENERECYVDDVGLAATVETEVNPAYRNANNQYNTLRLVENFEDDLQ